PLGLDFEAAEPVLALGGDLKGALCLVKGGQAVLSEHLGDLAHPAAFRNFLGAQERLCRLLRAKPLRLAADLHPDYVSTRWAQRQGLDLCLVQHHHAHLVSAMVEHGLQGPVVGIACDGTGYGTDGGIWGGEILVCDRATWRRAAHLAAFPLLGGDAAAHEPWRPALGWLRAALPETWTSHLPRLERMAGKGPVSLAVRRMQGPSPGVACSSLGRLFDAAAALLGYCDRNRYEAEAAMILQQAAESAAAQGGVGLGSNAGALPWAVLPPAGPGAPRVLDTAPLLKALVAGRPRPQGPGLSPGRGRHAGRRRPAGGRRERIEAGAAERRLLRQRAAAEGGGPAAARFRPAAPAAPARALRRRRAGFGPGRGGLPTYPGGSRTRSLTCASASPDRSCACTPPTRGPRAWHRSISKAARWR
ncbi:MAG TPA: hypothetical protein VNZ67_13105, partial [bacterium]|nr:hypothetical protein [bacterium]